MRRRAVRQRRLGSARGQREAATGSVAKLVGTRRYCTGHDARQARPMGAASCSFPTSNIHVAAKLQLLGKRQLKLTGCALGKAVCRSQMWTRDRWRRCPRSRLKPAFMPAQAKRAISAANDS